MQLNFDTYSNQQIGSRWKSIWRKRKCHAAYRNNIVQNTSKCGHNALKTFHRNIFVKFLSEKLDFLRLDILIKNQKNQTFSVGVTLLILQKTSNNLTSQK